MSRKNVAPRLAKLGRFDEIKWHNQRALIPSDALELGRVSYLFNLAHGCIEQQENIGCIKYRLTDIYTNRFE